jgi:lipoprotein-releasing system permease protein
MSWPLYLALKQLFPTGRRFPFFTAISILGVALGVALLIVSISVMGGFGREIRRMIVNTQGEVQVRASGLMQDPAAVLAAVEHVPGVVAATPFAEGVVMLKRDRQPAFPAIQGVDMNRVESVVPLRRYVMPVQGFDDLDDDRVILSSQLALTIGARLGSRVEVYSPLLLEKLKADAVLMPRELEVCGIFEIGHQQLDSSVVIVTLRTMQELYGLGTAVHGVNVKLADGADPDAVARAINRALPVDGVARSWMDANQEFLFVLHDLFPPAFHHRGRGVFGRLLTAHRGGAKDPRDRLARRARGQSAPSGGVFLLARHYHRRGGHGARSRAGIYGGAFPQ